MNHIVKVTCGLFFLIGCEFNAKKESSDTLKNFEILDDTHCFVPKARWNSDYKLVTIDKKQTKDTIDTRGRIDVPPSGRMNISSIMGGYIKNIPYIIGHEIKQDQTLFAIENLDFVELQQLFLEEKYQLEFLKATYKRQRSLYKDHVSSEKVFLKAKSAYFSSKARVYGLKKRLEMLNVNTDELTIKTISSFISIKAPMDGFITNIRVKSGTFVEPQTELLEIINKEHLHLELIVYEKDVLKLKVGQKIVFKIPEVSEKDYEAELFLRAKNINEDRTINIHAHLKGENNEEFLIGMFVRARIIVKGSDLAIIQKDAVYEENGGSYLLKLQEETDNGFLFEKVKIKKGVSVQGQDFISIENAGELEAGKYLESKNLKLSWEVKKY